MQRLLLSVSGTNVERWRAIVSISNARFCLLRYKRGELEGKNVSCLMPQPFSSRHDSYLQNYVDTGACVRVRLCVCMCVHV